MHYQMTLMIQLMMKLLNYSLRFWGNFTDNSKVNRGLEGTSETPKLGVQPNLVKNEGTKSGSTAIFDCIRPAVSIKVRPPIEFLNGKPLDHPNAFE